MPNFCLGFHKEARNWKPCHTGCFPWLLSNLTWWSVAAFTVKTLLPKEKFTQHAKVIVGQKLAKEKCPLVK